MLEVIWFDKRRGFGIGKDENHEQWFHRKEVCDGRKIYKGKVIRLKSEDEWDIV